MEACSSLDESMNFEPASADLQPTTLKQAEESGDEGQHPAHASRFDLRDRIGGRQQARMCIRLPHNERGYGEALCPRRSHSETEIGLLEVL